jgi:hypothetical protein
MVGGMEEDFSFSERSHAYPWVNLHCRPAGDLPVSGESKP